MVSDDGTKYFLVDQGDEVDIPRERKISLKEWGRLGVVWLCCTLAAGLIPGQAVFASMFADVGVYSELCEHDFPCDGQLSFLNMMLGMGMMLVMFAQLPVGLLFDLYGGRTVGTLGSCLVATGLSLEAIPIFSAIKGTSSVTNWLVPVAAIITDFGSILNSYCFFSLIWHYPGSTNVILSLSTATYQVSALLPMFLQRIMDATGIHLGQAMLGFAATVLASALVIWQVTPTQQQYYDRAKEMLGVPLPKPKRSFDLCSKLWKGWAAVRMDIKDHFWLGMGFVFSSTFATLYNSMSSAYGRHLFGSENAGQMLANMQVETTAAVGAICAPFIAKIADFLGLQLFGWMLTSFVAVPLLLFLLPAWWAAWVTTAGLCLFTTLYNLFMSRYFLHYAPPNRLGVYSGVFTIFMMSITLPFSLGSYFWMMSQPDGANRYFLPYMTTGVVGLLFLVAFNIRFCRAHDGNGVPKMPHLLPEDEMELAMPFGAMNLDEAAGIVGLDTEEFFRRLADPDPESLKKLLRMVNTDKVEAALAQHSADDMIAMLEAQPEFEEEDDEKEAVLQVDSFAKMSLEPQDGAMTEMAVLEPATSDAVKAAPSAQNAASVLRELFRDQETSVEARKAVLEGEFREPDQMLRCRALGECLNMLVNEGDAEGCKLFMLEVPVEDQWASMVAMEEWMDEQQGQEMEKKFGKLIPPKEFARLMRKKPQLKDLFARLMKREVQRTAKRLKMSISRKIAPLEPAKATSFQVRHSIENMSLQDLEANPIKIRSFARQSPRERNTASSPDICQGQAVHTECVEASRHMAPIQLWAMVANVVQSICKCLSSRSKHASSSGGGLHHRKNEPGK